MSSAWNAFKRHSIFPLLIVSHPHHSLGSNSPNSLTVNSAKKDPSQLSFKKPCGGFLQYSFLRCTLLPVKLLSVTIAVFSSAYDRIHRARKSAPRPRPSSLIIFLSCQIYHMVMIISNFCSSLAFRISSTSSLTNSKDDYYEPNARKNVLPCPGFSASRLLSK